MYLKIMCVGSNNSEMDVNTYKLKLLPAPHMYMCICFEVQTMFDITNLAFPTVKVSEVDLV